MWHRLFSLFAIWALTLGAVSATNIYWHTDRKCGGNSIGCSTLTEASCCQGRSDTWGSLAITGNPWAGLYVRVYEGRKCEASGFQTHRGSANPPPSLCHPLKKGMTTGSARWWQYGHSLPPAPKTPHGKRDEDGATNCKKADTFTYMDQHGERNYVKIPEENFENHVDLLLSYAQNGNWTGLSAYEKFKDQRVFGIH